MFPSLIQWNDGEHSEIKTFCFGNVSSNFLKLFNITKFANDFISNNLLLLYY